MSDTRITWSTDVFLDCYNSIRTEKTVSPAHRQALQNDLRDILVVPQRNEKSRSALAAGESGKPVLFNNGIEFTLNQAFVTAASSLASELNLDEIHAAELLQECSTSNFAQGSSEVDAGILGFYQRYSYILNIFGFFISERQLDSIYPGNIAQALPQILKSFKQIYALVSLQNDFIDKQSATGDVNNLQFVNKISYAKEQLFELHDLLAQILYSFIDVYIGDYGTYETFKAITTHINDSVKNDSDSLLLHFFPSLMRIITSLLDLKDEEVKKFHQSFVQDLTADYAKVNSNGEIDVSKSSMRPYEQLLQMIFYISFVPWCKQADTRTKIFNFESDILKYAEWLINYGVMEQLLSFTAESASLATEVTFDQSKLFDFRPLLQKSFPRLSPVLFTYARNEELLHVVRTRPGYSNLLKLCDYLSLTVSASLRESLLAPFFHSFFCDFVNHSAIILTSLRDSEEDFLLSSINKKQLEADSIVSSSENKGNDDHMSHDSESANKKSDFGIELDEIASRAELERFYLSFAYTYSNRAELCYAFWTHDNANVVGFIGWGLANNTSPLITATFCLLLGSLTYGGRNTSDKVWELLLNSGLAKRNDYTQISIDSIVHSLSYYIDAIQESVGQELRDRSRSKQEKHDSLFSNKSTTDDEKTDPVQLSEDSVVFIAGFMMLVGMMVENLSTPALKQAAFLHFHPVILSFLELDNLITSTKILNTQNKSTSIFLDGENRTSIINLVLNLLTKFACNAELDLKCKIWVMVDKWICHSAPEGDSIGSESSRTSMSVQSSMAKKDVHKMRGVNQCTSMKKGFEISLSTISEVLNFVKLLENLLQTELSHEGQHATYTIPFPADLGQNYRQRNLVGIWPYIEFLVAEVFGESSKLKSKEIKFELQKLILSITVSSLRAVDWRLIDESARKILPDFSKFEDRFASAITSSGEQTTLSLQNYSRLHHSFAVINYLFNDNASSTLFEIINMGSEDTTETSNESLVVLALDALHLLLKMQSSFIDNLSILKNFDGSGHNRMNAAGYGTSMSLMLSSPQLEYNNIYYPDTVGMKGVSDFYEVLLFHTSSIAHVALFVGSANPLVANRSLDILHLVSRSLIFVPNNGRASSQSNRLLSIFQSIDESEKIKFAFVQQLETFSPTLESKCKILEFLIDNLPVVNQLTVAHFLLGFEIKADKIYLPDSKKSGSLLRCLLELLLESTSVISEIEFTRGYSSRINPTPTKFSSLIMQVFVKLCRNSVSSRVTLDFLRHHGLFVTLVNIQPKIDELTVWNDSIFDGDLREGDQNNFMRNDQSRESFFNFVSFRNSVLEYLSLELHAVTIRSHKDQYVGLLLDGSEFLDGSAKILNFLDVLNFRFFNGGDYNLGGYQSIYNLHPLVRECEAKLDAFVGDTLLKTLTSVKCKIANTMLPDEDTKVAFEVDADSKAVGLSVSLKKALAVQEMKTVYSKTLHSWVQIVQVLATEDIARKTNFIPQVLQIILPKLNNDYYEHDVHFAEELISLCLFLFDLFGGESGDHKETTVESPDSRGLLALFKTSINGLFCSASTSALRSDLYLLINKFISRGLESELFLKELMALLRSIDLKFVDVVCKDAIYSEGVSRITALVLLESLVHIFGREKSLFDITALTKHNSLSLMVRSLKRADEIVVACGDGSLGKRESGISIETLLYELTAFKSTLSVFMRLSQTRSGALLLVQNEIFLTLGKLKFLTLDADLGVDFAIQDASEGATKEATITLALDVPLTLREKNAQKAEDLKSLSLYEILTPIFQLIATILLSLGPSYKPAMAQVGDLMHYSQSVVRGIMKRDSLIENNRVSLTPEDIGSDAISGLKQLVHLFTLISTVVSSAENGTQ